METCSCQARRTAGASKKSVTTSKTQFDVLEVEDSGDESFEASVSDEPSGSESDSNEVSMQEVCDTFFLPLTD